MDLKKRKFVRHPLSYPLKTRIIHPNESIKEVLSESDNISAGGLLFTCDEPVIVGSEVEIELKVEKREFLLTGKVVRCEKKKGQAGYSIAIAFNSPNEFLKMRMMEQVVRIELLKTRFERRYGVKLEFARVAKEWIKRYSEQFAKYYDV